MTQSVGSLKLTSGPRAGGRNDSIFGVLIPRVPRLQLVRVLLYVSDGLEVKLVVK